MSYKWPGIPNGDYSFDHGRAVWNRIINFLRRLCEKLDGDLVDATADRRGMMTAADKAALDAVPETYVKKTGDTVTGNINSTYGVNGVETVNQYSGEMAGDDLWAIRTGVTGRPDPEGAATGDNGFLEIATADNGTEPIYISQYIGDHILPDSQGERFYQLHRRATLLDEQGNTVFPGTVTALNFNGNATSANYATSAGTAAKLGTSDVGSATQPIYLEGGVATACTYQLYKTVPADAVFTDTVYSHPTYTARTGKPTADQMPGFGGTVTVSQIESDSTGHVTAATDRTITIPSTAASATSAGLVTTGTQTFAGSKLFNNSVATNSYIRVWTPVLGENASAWNELSFYSREDSLRLGMLRAHDYADGRHYLQLTATNTNPNNPDQSFWASIELSAYPDGTVTAEAPTPVQPDDSKKIATTAYVKDCVPKAVGSATTPVFSNADGVITACTYELKKTVPADAVFTDHIYSAATQSTDGLMSADDKKLVDTIPDLGTFNRMFFSQTSGTFVAPRTGVYRITLKGGGGGGGALSSTTTRSCGTGGGEGGTLIFYETLTKNASYAYTIGAGGAAGINATENDSSVAASSGGNTTITINNATYTARGGGSGAPSGNLTKPAGGGGSYTIPSGKTAFGYCGLRGQVAGWIGNSTTEKIWAFYIPGGGPHNNLIPSYGAGGSGATPEGYREPLAGGDGFILIEYAG